MVTKTAVGEIKKVVDMKIETIEIADMAAIEIITIRGLIEGKVIGTKIGVAMTLVNTGATQEKADRQVQVLS